MLLPQAIKSDWWELRRYGTGLLGAWAGSVYDFEAIFFDDGIGKDFFGDALELFLGFVAVPAVEIQNEEFSLADVFDGGVAEAGKGVMDGLALGVENGALWHDPDVCFHAGSITLPRHAVRFRTSS